MARVRNPASMSDARSFAWPNPGLHPTHKENRRPLNAPREFRHGDASGDDGEHRSDHCNYGEAKAENRQPALKQHSHYDQGEDQQGQAHLVPPELRALGGRSSAGSAPGPASSPQTSCTGRPPPRRAAIPFRNRKTQRLACGLPKNSCTMALGGVPTRVSMPPKDASERQRQ